MLCRRRVRFIHTHAHQMQLVASAVVALAITLPALVNLQVREVVRGDVERISQDDAAHISQSIDALIRSGVTPVASLGGRGRTARLVTPNVCG